MQAQVDISVRLRGGKRIEAAVRSTSHRRSSVIEASVVQDVLDLGDPGHAHTKSCRDVALGEAQLLAGLGELVPAALGEQRPRSGLDLIRGDVGCVQFPL